VSREIKFRALKDDISNCNWFYGQLVYDAIGQARITEVDSSGKGLTFHTCINKTVGQFTGLKDKNGVEIYEGDIVYCEKKFYNEHKAVVKWLDNRCGFYFIVATVGTDIICREPFLSAYKINSFKVEVIGNIHQTSEQ